MNAIEDNSFTQGWRKFADKLPPLKGILVISAHWETEGTFITASKKPETIHDFYGFPKELYDVPYPAIGSPELALKIRSIVSSVNVGFDHDRGLDHGTWSVLMKMFPKPIVPILQLSLDINMSFEQHLTLGKQLRPLREKGILIIGSGNIVHNLRLMRPGQPFPFALEFDKYVKDNLLFRDEKALIDLPARLAEKAMPTSEHYLPLLYAFGASDGEKPEFFNEEFFMCSLSMACVSFQKP
ncbi:MAG: 4,5-DOPA dioxygenase extradiol [Nanoarchaeota archaeon]|nr:4,5-DOPA dioxygenase extradiol [Nanoarchaeota archaeon]